MPDQLAYLHFISLTLLNALKRLPEMYLADAEIRRIVPLSEAEEAWLRNSWGPSQRDNNPVFGRLDGVIEFTSPMWKDSLKFIEPNLSGVGGIHLAPTGDSLIADFVIPVLKRIDPTLQLERGTDLRELFIQEVLDHLEAIGRPGQHVCFVEPKYADTGIDEQTALAEYYLKRHGLKILHADPAELYIKDGEVCYEGSPIDVAYRDYEVRDLIALAARERREHRADAKTVSRKPHDLVDGRRFRSQKFLGNYHRSGAGAALFQRRRTASFSTACGLDPAAVRPSHDIARRRAGRAARSSFANTKKSSC